MESDTEIHILALSHQLHIRIQASSVHALCLIFILCSCSSSKATIYKKVSTSRELRYVAAAEAVWHAPQPVFSPFRLPSSLSLSPFFPPPPSLSLPPLPPSLSPSLLPLSSLSLALLPPSPSSSSLPSLSLPLLPPYLSTSLLIWSHTSKLHVSSVCGFFKTNKFQPSSSGSQVYLYIRALQHSLKIPGTRLISKLQIPDLGWGWRLCFFNMLPADNATVAGLG